MGIRPGTRLPAGVGPIILLVVLLSLYFFTTIGVDATPDRNACQGTCPATTRIALQPAPSSPAHLLIEVGLAGKRRLMLLDTGSELSYLDETAAKADGLFDAARPIFGALNESYGLQRVLEIDDLSVGDFGYGDFEMSIVDLTSVRDSLAAELAGVLGMNVLGVQSFVLDFETHTLHLDAGALEVDHLIGEHTCPHGVPAKWVGRSLYVPVDVGGHSGHALVDSGAFPSEIDRTLAVGLPTSAPEQVVSFSARREADDSVVQTIVPVLRVGSLQANHVPMLLANESVLGADFFRSLVLAVPGRADQIVIASPRPPDGRCGEPPPAVASGPRVAASPH